MAPKLTFSLAAISTPLGTEKPNGLACSRYVHIGAADQSHPDKAGDPGHQLGTAVSGDHDVRLAAKQRRVRALHGGKDGGQVLRHLS